MPAAQVPGMMTTFEIVKPGSGTATVSKGSKVTVHAEGNVQQADGSLFKFWSTKDPGQKPFEYQAGVGGVIAGWDQGLLAQGGAKKGEVRKLVIPATEGYGMAGFPAWKIPPRATLVFMIETLLINGA